MYWVYSLVTAAGVLLLSPYLVLRNLAKGKPISHLKERLGWRFPAELTAGGANASPRPTIWIHAVSVGEVLAVLPLARQLKANDRERRLVVSTTTATGQRIAREKMTFADAIFYFPLDWNGPVRRAFAAVHPAGVIIVETEIWPNFLRQARRAGIPVIFVNGRLSERSARGFQRAMAVPGGVLRRFLKGILDDATVFLMQSEGDAGRLLALGAERHKVSIAGNLKYDFGGAQPTAFSNWLRGEAAGSDRRPVIVAGSVVANEELPVLEAFQMAEAQFPRALLVMAPRKPERFDAAAQILEGSGRRVIRRSTIRLGEGAAGGVPAPLRELGSALLLDTVGELASIYALADAVFVGGSLVPSGGHNILEPAACGRAPIFGESMENFREMAAAFAKAGAGIQVQNSKALGEAWLALLSDTAKAESMGAAARALVEKNRGATARTLDQIERYLKPVSVSVGSVE